MKRFSSILRDTWWVWIILIGGGTFAGVLLSPIFYSAIPISLVTMIYFAIVRYDDQGELRRF